MSRGKNGHIDRSQFADASRLKYVETGDLPRIQIGNIESYKHEYELENMKVEIPNELRTAWEIALGLEHGEKPSPRFSLWDRFKNFLAAKNMAGKIARPVKDALLLFAPKWLSVGYDTVDDFILNKIKNDMPTLNDKKTLFSRQILIFGAIFIIALLQQFGLDLGLMLSPEANWVGMGAGVLGIFLRLITGRPVKLGSALGIADIEDK